jgi:hypothetical protein
LDKKTLESKLHIVEKEKNISLIEQSVCFLTHAAKTLTRHVTDVMICKYTEMKDQATETNNGMLGKTVLI